MPISSKKIIKFIKEGDKQFTLNDIYESYLGTVKNIKKKSKKKNKKKKFHLSKKDNEKIRSSLSALQSIGLIKIKKNKYTRTGPLVVDGRLHIDRSGDGLFTNESGFEAIVKKKFNSNARNNDFVSIEITDYKNGFFYGEIYNIKKREKNRYIAKTEKVTQGLLYLQVLDTQSYMQACAELPIKNIKEPYNSSYFQIELKEKFRLGIQTCKILKQFDQDNEKYDVNRIIIKRSLPFPHRDYKELHGINDNFSEDQLKGRKNYRNDFTITIDGADAKDFDDAVSIKRLKNGFMLFVHIADVSSYIKKGSSIDKEAYKRGTSYYLGAHVIPMLPEILSNEFCSLKKDRDRLTISAEIKFDSTGDIINARFFNGVIKVKERLTYKTAADIIKNNNESKANTILQTMLELASLLKKKRSKEGRIDLNLTDEEIIYDGYKIKDIKFTERLVSHLIIEEFMLSANQAAAVLLKEKNIPSLYRVHEKISDEKSTSLANMLRLLKLKLKKTGSIGKNIQKILEMVKGKNNEHMVNLFVLKSMMQAFYGVEPVGHFGLGFKDYTHFTSPIRRYPDLIVHRCLKNIIDKKDGPYSIAEMIDTGKKSSEMERVAQSAERDLIKLKSCRLMKNRIGETFNGIISGIAKFGLFVELFDIPIEGAVPYRNLKDYFIENDDNFSIKGERTGKIYRIGDKIKVKLLEVKIDRLEIDFSII